MKRSIVFILVCFMFFSQMTNTIRSDELNLNALSAVLIDSDTGRILYGKNPHEKRSMASTTKIMTCTIALEYGNLEDHVKFSDYAASMPKVKMGGKSGEEYKLKDLLYALMLESYNDAAVAIAEHIGGSVEGFAKLMNEKAAQIGAYETNFVTPNGLDAQNHYSTAYDMALIGAYAVKNDAFNEITNTKNYSFTDIEGKRNISVSNKDAFLSMMEGAIGIKTGFTGEAGYCFVGAVKDGEHHLVSAVLGSGWPPNKSFKWRDTLSLMKYGVENYSYEKVFEGIEDFAEMTVLNGKQDKIETYIDGNFGLLLAKHEDVTTSFEIKKEIEAPVNQGECVGAYHILVNDEVVSTFNICAGETVEKIDYNYCFAKLLHEFLPLG